MRFDSVIVGRSDRLEMMVSDAIKMTKEIKEKIGVKNAATLRKGKAIMDRIEDVEVYKSNELALMYNDLAPEDIEKPINTSMMRNFLEEVIKKDNPDAYEKIWKYYNLSEVLPEKYMKKLAIFIEKVWSQYRTIEYCYQYSKSFYDFVEKYAKKVDAEGMSNLDKIKWFRLWLFVIKVSTGLILERMENFPFPNRMKICICFRKQLSILIIMFQRFQINPLMSR